MSHDAWLTDEERARFLRYLIAEADGTQALVEQMEKPGALPPALVEAVTKQNKKLVSACRFLAVHIMRSERQEIG